MDDPRSNAARYRAERDGEAEAPQASGPPVVTPLHDIEKDVRAWRERRAAKPAPDPVPAPRGSWIARFLRGAA